MRSVITVTRFLTTNFRQLLHARATHEGTQDDSDESAEPIAAQENAVPPAELQGNLSPEEDEAQPDGDAQPEDDALDEFVEAHDVDAIGNDADIGVAAAAAADVALTTCVVSLKTHRYGVSLTTTPVIDPRKQDNAMHAR